MRTPSITGTPPPAIAPLRASLAVGQILPVRLVTPEDAQDLLAMSKALVVETTLGLARLHPPGTRAAPLPSPAQLQASVLLPTPPPAAAEPSARRLLEVVSLAPLRVRLLPEGRDASSRAYLPTLGSDWELEWLAATPAAKQEAGISSTGAPHSRGAPSGAGTSAPFASDKPQAPRQDLLDSVQTALRQLLPRAGEFKLEWPRLLHQLERLAALPEPEPGADDVSRTLSPSLVVRLARQIVEDAVAKLPDASALRQSLSFAGEAQAGEDQDALPLAANTNREGQARHVRASQEPAGEALSRLLKSLLGAARQPVRDAAQANPKSVLSATESAGLAENAGDVLLETAGRQPLTPPRSPWPEAARALRALLMLAGEAPRAESALPSPEAETARITPSDPRFATPSFGTSPTTGSDDAPLASLLRHALNLRLSESASSGESRSPPVLTAAEPAVTNLLQELGQSLEKLAARSQGQQLNQISQSLHNPGLFQWELPIRDGRTLDFFSLLVEARDESPTAQAVLGKSYWSCQLQFDFPQFGPIRAMLNWQAGRVDTRFFAERPATAELLNQELGWLSTALSAAGVDAEVHPCQQVQLSKPEPRPDVGQINLTV